MKKSEPPSACDDETQSVVCSKEIYNTLEDISEVIPIEDMESLEEVSRKFNVRIPNHYLSLIDLNNLENDPIYKQCMPSVEELEFSPVESADPLGEESMSPVSCLVHRYPDRVLLLVTGTCFMYCRHCTRKRLWEKGSCPTEDGELEKAFDYIRSTSSIREVVVSGGDPLTLSNSKIDWILSRLSEMDHIEVIRIGTRAPVVYPNRITESLCRILEKYEKLWVNVQFNHPSEIVEESILACKELQRCGIPVSNQSVLLRGINDDPEVMKELCQKLQSIRIRVYYLFQCDPVIGAHHFRTSVLKGIEILEYMRGHTSGMCIPTFVVDGVEGHGKVPVSPNYLLSMSEKGVLLRNYENKVFFYE